MISMYYIYFLIYQFQAATLLTSDALFFLHQRAYHYYSLVIIVTSLDWEELNLDQK